MDAALRDELIGMVRADFALREQLAANGSLNQGYHPDMRAVHEANADRLAAILDQHGWPGAALVDIEGNACAWLIAQHAISRPALMRRVRDLTIGEHSIAPAQWAMLDDRIAVFEGREQSFGTQFDWDDAGQMSPFPIVEPDGIDARREVVGLPPLHAALARHRAEAGSPPADLATYRQDQRDFARAVGWLA